jgi:hypothetical protein
MATTGSRDTRVEAETYLWEQEEAALAGPCQPSWPLSRVGQGTGATADRDIALLFPGNAGHSLSAGLSSNDPETRRKVTSFTCKSPLK